MSYNLLAFDLGASSGRAIIGTFENNKISLKEIHRFSNEPVSINGTLYWDILRLFNEIKQGILKATRETKIDGIGIDTWGVDFGLIDKGGKLLSNPVHYRDERTVGIPEKVFNSIFKNEIFEKTGISFMRINTLYQLCYLNEFEPEMLDLCDKFLNIPDLLAYFLTGAKRSEVTIASTSNLLNPETKNWDFELIKNLKLPEGIFANIIQSGEVYGKLSLDVCNELGCDPIPVIAISSHDTACAVVSAPAENEDFVYISCGTWSLLGIENDKPITSSQAFEANFTNEQGYNNKIRFLKNIMGLWLIQESKRTWEKQGLDVSFDMLEKLAIESEPFKCFVDVDDSSFETPGNMPKKISEYCKKTGQYEPKTIGEIMRCIYDSLALKYKYTINNLQAITNKQYTSINMLGGGIKDVLLCQMTANACNVPVYAGPVEATSMGNIAVQLISLQAISSLKEAREIIKNSTDIKTYLPQNTEQWEQAYKRYVEIVGGLGV